jgi:uncharacterized protein (TIGR03000 family)
MKRRIALASLAAAALLAAAGPAQAQFRYYGGRGGTSFWIGTPGLSFGYGPSYPWGYSGYYRPYSWGYAPYNYYSPYGSYGLNPYYSYPGYSQWYNRPYGGGWYSSSPSNYYMRSASYQPGYDSSWLGAGPSINLARGAYDDQPAAGGSSSVGMSPVWLRVRVPEANARVWVDGHLTQQTGTARDYVSPPVQAGKAYSYTVKAAWMDNGQEVTRERTVSVSPGQETTVSFMDEAGDNRSGSQPADAGTRPGDTRAIPDDVQKTKDRFKDLPDR